MFLFKNKKKKKSHQDLPNQDSANTEVYVQDDHLLNIKLPDDFSSIILPQLIGYEQDEDGNTINSSTIILRQKQQQQQQQIQTEEDHHHHSVPTREGWYPATRLVGSESNRGTLVDTTNITAASLVQVNQRQSTSVSSSSGDTLTSHSKEDSIGSLDPEESHPSSSYSQQDHPSSSMPHLRKDRPKFKRNHPRSTVLKTEINQLSETPSTINSTAEASQPDLTLRQGHASPTSGTLKKSIKPPTCFVSPEPLHAHSKTSIHTHTPLIKNNEDDDEDKKAKQPVPLDKKKRISGVKLSNEPILKPRPRQHQHQLQQKKRASAIISSTVNVEDTGSMIPRRPLSSSSFPSQNDKSTTTITPTAPVTSKIKKTKQTRTMTINNNTLGGGSRIPVRSQTMKV